MLSTRRFRLLGSTKVLRDISGGALIEATLVLPLMFFLALGTVDAAYYFYEWNLANKATYWGARAAAVSNPVAPNVVNLTESSSQIGQPCYLAATGSANPNGSCPTFSVVCTSTSCTPNTYGFSGAAFTNANKTGVFDRMQQIFPRLQASNVQITYQTTAGLGYFGQPYSGNSAQFTLPMNVTVNIHCMTHQFFFIRWAWSAQTGCPANPNGPYIPAFPTTMQSESMFTQ
jgi:Flp pilus assembly protein TadG